MSKSPEERRAALRAWLEGLAAEPPRGLADATHVLELAGELFDDEHLDGEQYAAVYDVGRAIKSEETASLAGLARRCLALIR